METSHFYIIGEDTYKTISMHEFHLYVNTNP
jgi:hypothetical protein